MNQGMHWRAGCQTVWPPRQTEERSRGPLPPLLGRRLAHPLGQLGLGGKTGASRGLPTGQATSVSKLEARVAKSWSRV
jgi:hypothetical protein